MARETTLGLIVEWKSIVSSFRVPYNSLLWETFRFPPKTTAVGMVGAAYGWSEEEFLQILPQIKYGVIIEQMGQLATETAVLFKNKTAPIYPITKQMLYQAQFTLFFSTPNQTLLQSMHEALYKPEYVVTLGDSENVAYPLSPNFAHLVEITPTTASTIRCILPSDLYRQYNASPLLTNPKREQNIILPTDIKIPVNFLEKGKKRRFISQNITYYSGLTLQLATPLEVFDFHGESVVLF